MEKEYQSRSLEHLFSPVLTILIFNIYPTLFNDNAIEFGKKNSEAIAINHSILFFKADNLEFTPDWLTSSHSIV